MTCHDTPVSQELLEELASRWFTRFKRALVRRGFSALEFQGGLDVRTVTADSSGALGVYLAKLALEVTGGMTKTGRRTGSRTMWQVLADGLATASLTIWRRGPNTSRAATTESRSRSPVGLRRRYRLAEEESDEEIAETDLGSDDLIALPAETSSVIRGCAEQLLTAAETDGLTGALAWLMARGLEWVWAGPGLHRDEWLLRPL